MAMPLRFLPAIFAVAAAALLARPVTAAPIVGPKVLFDFEGPYLVDPGRTIKDHAMVFENGQWHCFYIRGQEGESGTASEREIGRAVSSDLRNWTILQPAVVAGSEGWDSRNVWAPAIFPSDNGSGWSMLYTGTNALVVQRMGRAYTNGDLLSPFVKFAANPLLAPDPVAYLWAEDRGYSAFRDPFHFKIGPVHHVLNTAVVEDLSIPAGRRAVVHHATSTDLVNWTDVGPLLTHNGPPTSAWREIESAQLRQWGGWWHFFYTEFGATGVRHLRSQQMDSGWDFNQYTLVDDGIAAEVSPLDGDSFLFTRHIPTMHTPDHPDSSVIFYVLRADTLRFDPGTVLPEIVTTDPLAADWPVRTGTAFIAAPTFGDNSLERGERPTAPVGHGYVSSWEFYGGPGSGYGSPGAELGGGATGTMKSRVFDIGSEMETMSLYVAGGTNPACFVALVDAATDSVVHSTRGVGTFTFRPVIWDVVGLRGSQTYLWIEDASAASDGWIAVDHVTLLPSPVDAPLPASTRARLLSNAPNPFNPRTTLALALDAGGRVDLEIFDARGRRVRRIELGSLEPGRHEAVWNGRDTRGREVASGVYRVRLQVDGRAEDTRGITLVR